MNAAERALYRGLVSLGHLFWHAVHMWLAWGTLSAYSYAVSITAGDRVAMPFSFGTRSGEMDQ